MDVAFLIGKIKSLRDDAGGDAATSSLWLRSQILPLAPRSRPVSASAAVPPHSTSSVTAAARERSTPRLKYVTLHKVDESMTSTFNVGSGGKGTATTRPAGDRASLFPSVLNLQQPS